MANHFQLKKEFEPVVLPGQTVGIHKLDGHLDVLIIAVQGMPSRRWDAGDLTAGGSTLDQDNTALDMPVGEFAQYRFRVRDTFFVEMKSPAATMQQWKSDGNNWRVGMVDSSDPQEQEFMWAASEFWVFEDETPRFSFYTPTSAQSARAHVDFHGIRYSFRVLKEQDVKLPDFEIYMNGWPSGAVR